MMVVSPRIRLPGPVLLIAADERYLDVVVAALRLARIPCLSMDTRSASRFFDLTGFGAIALDLARAADWHAGRDLAARAVTHNVPVIAVSSWVAPDGRYRRRAFELGCAAFVHKSGSAKPLIEALHRIGSGERAIEVTPW